MLALYGDDGYPYAEPISYVYDREKLAVKYAPDDTAENRDKAIEREWKPLCMLEMEIEHLSGKQAVELI